MPDDQYMSDEELQQMNRGGESTQPMSSETTSDQSFHDTFGEQIEPTESEGDSLPLTQEDLDTSDDEIKEPTTEKLYEE